MFWDESKRQNSQIFLVELLGKTQNPSGLPSDWHIKREQITMIASFREYKFDTLAMTNYYVQLDIDI